MLVKSCVSHGMAKCKLHKKTDGTSKPSVFLSLAILHISLMFFVHFSFLFVVAFKCTKKAKGIRPYVMFEFNLTLERTM